MDIHCCYDKLVDPQKLTEHPRNPNTHPKEQIKLLAKIIANQGWRQPITVSERSGFIVKGHGRLAAGLVLGCSEVPVDYQDYPDEASEYADMIADNRIAELAEIEGNVLKDLLIDMDTGDFDMDLTGFDADALEDLLAPIIDLDDINEDDAPGLQENAVTELGRIYQLGKHRLMCGDSTSEDDVKRLMDGQKADMVFTAPPYGMIYGGGRTDRPKTVKGAAKDPTELYQCIPDAREVYVWGRVENWAHIKPNPRDVIVWKKNNFGLGVGYRGQYEVCFYWGDFKGSDSDVWEVAKDSEFSDPTRKPIALCVRAIKNSRPKNVLDVFAGSGSTMAACEAVAIPSYSMEIDPRYCDVIVRRYAALVDTDADTIFETGVHDG